MNKAKLSLARLIVLTFAAIFARTVHAADVKPLAIGSPAPSFNLPGVDGKQHALGEYKDAKILAVVFTCNHCPTAQAYEQRLIDLTNDYRDKGVAVVAINPNDAKAVRLDELGYTDPRTRGRGRGRGAGPKARVDRASSATSLRGCPSPQPSPRGTREREPDRAPRTFQVESVTSRAQRGISE